VTLRRRPRAGPEPFGQSPSPRRTRYSASREIEQASTGHGGALRIVRVIRAVRPQVAKVAESRVIVRGSRLGQILGSLGPAV